MPFKSEKQRRYLWANEPEIARDWTKTYGSKVKKADGGIMQDGYLNYTKGSDSVTVPKKFKARKDATPTHLAYITKAEAAQLKKQNKGTPHKGPKGIPSYDDYDAKSGSYTSGAAMSAAESGRQTGDTRAHGMTARDVAAHHQAAKAAARVSDRQTNRTGILGNIVNNISNFYRDNIYDRRPHDLKARRNFLMKNKLMKLDPVLDQDEYSDPRYSDSDWLTSAEGLKHLQGLGYTGGYSNVNDPNHPNYDPRGGGLPYIWPPVYTAAESAPGEEIASTGGLGEGHFRVPEQYRLAQGGRIGLSTGGIGDAMAARMVGRGAGHQTPTSEAFNFTPHQQDVMTRFQMEDIQTPRGNVEEESIEEKRFAGPDWYLERVEHLMFLGYSYEQAADIAYNTESYLEAIGSDFASGGRVGYGLGSFVKKPFKAAKKAIKKLTSSKLGKLALGYLATAGMANIMQPGAAQWGSPLGKGSGWLRPEQVLKNLGTAWGGSTVGADKGLTTDVIHNKSLWDKGVAALKNPWISIPAASAITGLLTAKKPVEEVGGIDKKWGKDKAWWDAYYANMPEDGDYRVEDEYILASAEGGRVAKNQGGLMNLGGLEKDYRNTGGFVEIGGKEKADDVPARLSRNEFVMTADAVRGAGGGDINKGAEIMDQTMKNLEAKGRGAKDMYQTATRISEVI